jgi:hypothetical protein
MTLKNSILIPIIRFLDQLCTQAASRPKNQVFVEAGDDLWQLRATYHLIAWMIISEAIH